jgi:23S rRNA (adenine2030-N6)-methyltransferase
MNYRHAFHAGNFADVVKHAVLCRILVHLGAKPGAFRVLDTHAGAGLYDLTGPEAGRSGEWRDGIARLARFQAERKPVGRLENPPNLKSRARSDAKPASTSAERALKDVPLDAAVAPLLAPYLDVVRALNPDGGLSVYPGSPALTRALLRPQDRLTACELEPTAAQALARHCGGDSRVKILKVDGWTALKAELPPRERRGLVLIDPPYERPDELAALSQGLALAHRKWATGLFLLWYPIKDRRGTDALARALGRLAIPKILRVELDVARRRDPSRLSGTGLILVNPPWTLEAELAILLPVLAGLLARDGAGAWRFDWLAGEK